MNLRDLNEMHAVATENWRIISAFGWRRGKPKKARVEVVDRRTWHVASSLAKILKHRKCADDPILLVTAKSITAQVIEPEGRGLAPHGFEHTQGSNDFNLIHKT